MARKIYPTPEFFSDQQWKINEARYANVDLENNVINCPLGTEAWETFLRTHEQGHVRFTTLEDAVTDDLNWDARQAVEDCRIHALMGDAGIDLSAGSMPDPVRAQYKELLFLNGTFVDRALCAIASIGTGDYPAALHYRLDLAERAKITHLADSVRNMLRSGGLKDHANAKGVTLWLMQELGLGPSPIPGGSRDGNGPHSTNRFRLYPDMRNEMGDVIVSLIAAHCADTKIWPNLVPWGRMKIDEPERTVATFTMKGKYRSDDHGDYLRNPHRLLVDGRIFTQRRRHKSVSILVDCSGSMQLKIEDLETLCRSAPASIIAGYAGSSHGEGELRIFAKNGLRVETLTVPGDGANVVDGPAVEWLAQQPEPRLWLTDCNVTGVGDQRGSGNWEYCDAVCKRARIQHMPTMVRIIAAAKKGWRMRAV